MAAQSLQAKRNNLDAIQRRREQNVANGLCRCGRGRPIEGMKSCLDCKIAYASSKQARKRRKARAEDRQCLST